MDANAKVIPFHLHPLGFIEAFTRFGADLNALLAGTGISHEALKTAGAKISYAQQAALIRTGVGLCRKPGLGLLAGMHFDWLFFGTVGEVVHCSPTLREAGEAFRRYLMIAQPYYAMCERKPSTFVDGNGTVTEVLQCLASGTQPAAVTQFELEFRLATQLRIWDACGNKSVRDSSVHVCLAIPEPAYAHMFQRLPCTTVRFGCTRSHLEAHHSFICTPFREYRRHAFRVIIQRCEQELREANLEPSCEAKVRWHVHAYFDRPVALEQVARLLTLTPRALTRRLAAEGTTFREIVHQVRMEIAAYHLQSSRLSVGKIAELLGFSSESSLRRALRNWTGAPVSTMRGLNAKAISPDNARFGHRVAPVERR